MLAENKKDLVDKIFRCVRYEKSKGLSDLANIKDLSNLKHPNGESFLHCAIRDGSFTLIKALANKKNVNELVTFPKRGSSFGFEQRYTALQIITGMVDPHDHALAHFARNFTDFRGDSIAKMHRIVKILIKAGAHLDIFSAAALGDIDFVKKQLQGRPDLVNAKAYDGFNLLSWAIRRNQLEMVKFLVEQGAKINPEYGLAEKKPLYSAVQWASADVVRFLLDNGAVLTWVDVASVAYRRNRKNLLEIFDALISHVAKEQLSREVITSKVIDALLGFKSVEVDPTPFLKILKRYHIHIKEVDQVNKFILNQCKFQTPDVLRGLVEIGCNPSQKYGICIGAGYASNATPLILLSIDLANPDNQWDQSLLKNLTTLFYCGASVHMDKNLNPLHIHPIYSLNKYQLMYFFVYLKNEMESKPSNMFSHLPELSIKTLIDNLKRAKAFMDDTELTSWLRECLCPNNNLDMYGFKKYLEKIDVALTKGAIDASKPSHKNSLDFFAAQTPLKMTQDSKLQLHEISEFKPKR